MTRICGFPPIADPSARILILGSMPGDASLRANQYYAHPRNAFWRIVEGVFGIPADLDYEARCEGLRSRGVAVWDVLQTCHRTGSLDAAIDRTSLVANDFRGFLTTHGRIRTICFNGAMAAESFRRHVLPTLTTVQAGLPSVKLPSTSPANASYSFDRKLDAWRVIVR